ncbi:amino acid adenylation domain-containing protein [Iningainema tapete]|uniref:Amino acid adenylation domain-containing protein n=1 Tax=Iningainema tapete BLCC-T55 TaxID=2748662 RepID=A0A8J6XIG4_9CYAN|nr:amino acid adenylation domain-containing protein [Iningainema tapete]MBD2771979.1 amino acid adenylation domain-containing protein [Iningainema tapete BLCC-T55]
MPIPEFVSDKSITLHGLFEAQVEKTPEAIALVFKEEQLTYRELNERANQLAHYLHSLNVAPEMLVGICLERSIEMIVGMLGILKAGGAMVPLDPSQPQERKAFILADTKVEVLLTLKKLVAGIPVPQSHLVCLDTEYEKIATKSKNNPKNGVQSDNLAHTIYTSGSTGQPKGVMVNHQAICQGFVLMQEICPITQQDRVLQKMPLTFEFSFWELFWPLITGACVVLAKPGGEKDIAYLVKLIALQKISILMFVPSVLQVFLSYEGLKTCKNIRTIFSGGEPLTSALKNRFFNQLPNCQLYDLYGSTEDNAVTYWLCQPDEKLSSFPQGRPLPNVSIYVVDEQLQLVPVGETGELLVGGWGLARGYLNRPELTAQKFISNPFKDKIQERLYRTGDQVRYLSDGTIQILGRIDNQVKVRGFRIELGEIEVVLEAHPAVRQAVVLAREDVSGDKRLVAYVVPTSQESHPQEQSYANNPLRPNLSTQLVPLLRSYLKAHLPEYMVPSAFVLLEAFPLNPNGKVNRQALPAPDQNRTDRSKVYVEPRTPVEELLARIWSQILGIEQVGIYDNFFDLGGHSLLVTQLIIKVQQTFQVELPLLSLFEMPTVAELAQSIAIAQKTGASFTTVGTKTPVNLKAEAILDSTICPNTSAQYTAEPACIFLTGATGFIGAFLLHELLQQTHADIYCLVRAPNLKEGKKRIQSSLESYLLWNESLSCRIIPVVGDLSQPLLGLSQEEFQAMAELVDLIYHNGAWVHHTSPYSVLKAANVLGTQEVLRLASQVKVKPVHFISTLGVFSSVGDSGVQVVREHDSLDDYPLPLDGYCQSKWVAEKLVTIARERGLPVCIYRIGRISGQSQTGVFNKNDFWYKLILGCTQLGCVPEGEMLEDMVPVDYISRAIIYLSRRKESLDKVFHFVNHQSFNSSLLINVLGSLGYPLQQIPYDQWRKYLLKIAEHSPEHTLYPLVSFFPSRSSKKEMSNLGTVQFDCQNTLNGLAGTSIVCPPLDEQLLSTYLSYLIDQRPT